MSEDDRFKLILIAVAAVLCGLLIAFQSHSSEPDPSDDPAYLALASAGLKDVRITDRSTLLGEMYGCASHETYARASATNVRGERVTVLACCGWFLKACTLRY